MAPILRPGPRDGFGVGSEDVIRGQPEPSITLLEEVVASCGEAIISTDARETITTWNPAAERLFGVAAETIVGQSLHSVMPPGQDDEWRGFLEQVTTADAPHTREARARRSDGSLVDTEVVAAAIRDDDNTVTGYAFVVRDISHQKQARAAASDLMEQLQAANDALLQLNALKTDLVATISHEFRTPLTSIQGFSELLETEQLTRHEIRAFARTINQSALRLARMISDQLDLETLDSGQWPVHRTRISLNRLVERVIIVVHPLATNHRFVTDLASDLPAVDGDADLLERVIMNIVANAIKYSPAGGQITITTRRVDDGVDLAIADEGLGIPEEDREQIFAPYVRVGRPEHLEVDGTGLGLPIARRIVEVHQGRIWVEANHPRGTILRISLPASDADTERT